MPELSPKLAPWLAEWNSRFATMAANGYKLTVISAREELTNMSRSLTTDIPDVTWINDDLVLASDYNVPVRIYHPAPDQARPVIIFYHGGGHATGNVSVYDPIFRKVAAATGHIVVAPEYRLAPENPYPAGLMDAYNVAKNVWQTLDRRSLLYEKQLSLAGDSGGGGFASTICARAQFDYSINIANQILIYPSLDYTMCHASIEENARGYFLSKSCVAWYFDLYFSKGEDRFQASPLHGHITHRIPRTLMVSVGLDPLRDEAVQYLARLQSAGVPHRHLYFDDMIHAFLNMEDLVKEECQQVYNAMGDFLNGDGQKW